MDYQQHLLIGFISSLIIAILAHFILGWFSLDIKTIISLIVIVYVYSLLPDIDHPISKISWNFIGISIILIGLGVINNYYPFMTGGKNLLLVGVGLLILTFACAQWAGHRGIIHSIPAGLLFSSLPYFILNNWKFCIIAFIAYWSHLCADGEPFKTS